MQSMYIRVHVATEAKKELVERLATDRYDISVREPKERNLANARIRTLLARELGLREGAVRLVAGHRSPHKIFSVEESL